MIKKNSKTTVTVYYVVIIVLGWLWTTNIIQAIKCPQMTQTELFLHVPKSFMLEWNSCE